MRPEHLEKLNEWFMAQIAVGKAEGTNEQDFREGEVADLALRRIFEEHFEELRQDAGFIEEAFALVSDRTSPADLRGVAAQAQDHGQLEIGRYLELIANYREAETV
jgi:hypothetical protein